MHLAWQLIAGKTIWKSGIFTRWIWSSGDFTIVEGGEGGDCARCNRLRLTANGKIIPCLFSGDEYDVRKLGPAKAIQMAVENKPACGTANQKNEFYNIGG
jgi:GTP 3',8-cyclase